MQGRIALERREKLEGRIESLRVKMLSSGQSIADDDLAESHSILSEARSILAEEALLGPWEGNYLHRAAQRIEHRWMLRLALQEIILALTVAEQRATGHMPRSHYEEQVAQLSHL